MPNRILRACSLSSPSLDQLSDGGERLFFRLTLIADDYGRFEGDPRVVAAKCYPLRAVGMDINYIKAHYAELEQADLIRCYTSNGRRYGYFPTWADHQRLRRGQSKYPTPPSGEKVPQNAADILPQAAASSSPVAASPEPEPRAPDPIQSPAPIADTESCNKLPQPAARARAHTRARAAAHGRAPEPEPEPEPEAIKTCGTLPQDEPDPDPNLPIWLSPFQEQELEPRVAKIRTRLPAKAPRIETMIRTWRREMRPWDVCRRILDHILEHDPLNPEGYAHKIMAVEEPNFYEGQAITRHEAIKESERSPPAVVEEHAEDLEPIAEQVANQVERLRKLAMARNGGTADGLVDSD
ncbi:MAG: hypothetical protein IMY86_13800 [Chloroflexi bacterium]|nr:hypothetical protein [Chloroflexota bacterium]